MKKKKGTLFPEEVLNKVSINYRSMTIEQTDELIEIGSNLRFSRSAFHVTTGYLTSSCHKPVSLIDYEKLFEDEERKPSVL